MAHYDTFKQVILEYVRGKNFEPLGEKALFRKLSISPKFFPICRQILKDLMEEGVLTLKNKRYIRKGTERELVIGTLRVHVKGFGFLEPEDRAQYTQDVFIPKHLTDNAVDGDRVEIEINPDSNWEKGPDGKVIGILERGRTHVGATIHHFKPKTIAYAYSPLMGTSKLIAVKPKKTTKVGDRVVLKILDWGNEESGPTGEISHFIGHISDSSCDVKAAIEEFDLRSVFSPEVTKQALAWGVEVPKKELKSRKDLTHLTTLTIDPETAKDFDDALSITKDPKGNYHLGVHIADVAHYVPKDSPLDIEAQQRSNSTYFPGFCLPMLPHELSDNLCSLQPRVVRLTVSVMMTFDKTGNLQDYTIIRGFIKSAKRFTYEEAKDVLDGKEKSTHLEALNLMVELCYLLKEKRYERGSIDFSMPDLSILVDEKGHPHKMKRVEYDITHQLVEEFMLKANELVAKHLADKGKPVVYRIHEQPSDDDFNDFYAMARSLGFALPDKPSKQEIQELFAKAKKTAYIQQLSLAYIRSMKLAYYSPDNVGHYGLALDYYCHFTSPIRRYTDLVIQRLLFNEEGEDLDLEKVSEQCSDRERISFKAESSVKLLKKLRLLDHWMKEDGSEVYDAVVTKVKPFGLYFDLSHLMLEGFLHISELENDFFIFNANQNALVGRGSGKIHQAGGTLQVRPTAVDLVLLESRWELVVPKKQRRKK